MFTKVLVANRGEIALRVFRTCRELGITTVAVHTDLDADAPHVRDADEAVRVGSYLDVDEVVAAAVATGAEAVHPGYGFLSERAPFARAVTDAGIVFLGPSADVIDLMGRKDAAREVAVRAGVPVVPAYDLDDDPTGWTFPVLVKAAAGGGGKGMRVVRAAADLPEALAAAKREAQAAFGDDTMLVERYVERGRHVEVQVLGDLHGHVVHLGTRDCSAQRRHQKVVEEAPAPDLDATTRERLHAAAVDLAAEVGYAGAGTVEFLLDVTSGDFFFLEMNTRLQVEHPVTELVTGTDLVALQLRVAADDEEGVLPESPSPGTPTDGHAIEVRVYAEDPYAGFLPQAGRATTVRWPAGSGVRVDHALEDGQVVSTAYDPMLGKVVVHAADREAARRGLVRALGRTAVLGLTTNVGFLRELVGSDAFRDGEVDTAWLDRHEPVAPDAGPARRAAARAAYETERRGTGAWADDGFRLGGEPRPVTVELDEPVELDGTEPTPLVAAVSHGAVEVVHLGQRHVFPRPDPSGEPVVAPGEGAVAAPMPGTVLDVRVAEGDVVVAGQVLGVMEAMKMELSLTAGVNGTVVSVGAGVGDQVALGAVLFEVEAPETLGS